MSDDRDADPILAELKRVAKALEGIGTALNGIWNVLDYFRRHYKFR